MKTLDKIEVMQALQIYNQLRMRLVKFIKEKYNGAFQRIQFSDSTKLIVEYTEDGKPKMARLSYSDLDIY